MLLILVFCLSSGFGQIPPGYYNTAAGKSGETLQVALYNIIKGHTSVNYTPGVWNAFFTTDLKPNDSIWDMYSDIPGGTPPYEYTPGTEQCGNSGGEGDCYSREHAFPQSWFLEDLPMKTDLFHIYPVDQYVNNMHSDNPYGTVASPTWTSLNGSKKGPCSAPGYTGTVFEPRDEYKGDFARSYFYMATRYENLIASWAVNGSSSEVLDGTSYPAYKTWFLNLMIAWHNQDPVSAKEIARNEAVYQIQNNRNPYIDHPEYVSAVWIPSGPKAEPTNHVTGFTADTAVPSYSAVKDSWNDATGAVVPDGYLVRGSNVSLMAIATPVDGIPVADGVLDRNVAAGSQMWTFTGLAATTTYYFKIFPFTNSGPVIDYKTDGSVPSATVTTTAGIVALQPGDIAIIELDCNPDKFSFIFLKQINSGTVLNFTDNGFIDANTVRTTEGYLVYTAPSVLPAGTVVSWQYGMTITGTGWNVSNPTQFSIATGGDQVFAYQGAWGATNQTMICGVQEGNAGWLTAGDATSNTSYLPATLTNNVTATNLLNINGNYNLITNGTCNAIGSLVAHPANWTTSGAVMTTPAWNFTMGGGTVITQNATVQNLLVGSNESLTVQAGKTLTVLGTLIVSGN